MGIFSNRCEALVNPETGKALFGEALEKARQDPQWPRCGHSVKKSAKFCSKCGAPAPGGWVRCPVCGQWAGNDSQFCPHCNTPLYPDERAASAGGVWQKTPDVFAQRLEVQNVKDTEIRVQAGTAAILLDAGDVKDVLEAGEYKLEGLARKINWFNNPPPRSVILLDAGEIALPVAFNNVLTKSYESVRFYGEVILRFVGGKAAAGNFVSNFMKNDRRSLTFSDMMERLEPLFRLAVEDFCSTSTMDELSRDFERRQKLRDTIARALEDDLQATGLDVVRVSGCEFTSPEYEKRIEFLAEQKKRRQQEELEQCRDLDEAEKEKRRRELEQLKATELLAEQRRKAEFEAEQKAFESEQSLAKFKDEHELRRAMAALQDEYQLSEIERKGSWQRLMEKRADEDEARQRERAKAERAYREQEEEEARQKAKIQIAREEKERDESLIRRKAALARQWDLTDTEKARVRQEETRRFREAEERRAMRWEAVKVEAQRLWERKKEEWRREDERRKLEKQNEIEDVEHGIKIDEIKTTAEIQKRVRISEAIHAELIKKAENDVEVKKILTDGEVQVMLAKVRGEAQAKVVSAQGKADASVIDAKGVAAVRDMSHTSEIKEITDHLRVNEAKRQSLTSERAKLNAEMDDLAEKIERTGDPVAKQVYRERAQKNLARIEAIDAALDKLND